MSAAALGGRASQPALRLLITRPREDAARLAADLARHGIESLVEPLIRIHYHAQVDLDLADIQVLLATSANGVRAFALANDRRDLPVLAVGDATARTARSAGFERVESARGDVASLAALARRHCDPAAGALLHVAGSAVAGDLAGLLSADGFHVRRAVLYEARPIGALSAAAVAALERDELDGVALFSPRTAATWARLVSAAGVTQCCRRLVAFCLSAAVADAAGAVSWQRLQVAKQATQGALLADVLTARASVR
jgi:uroporphyrinogen-III synthase